ncbi:nidogen-like domain-containing protein [Methanobacterium formicicum]|uniref:Secreted protein n=1 Tax=Methanobacterium formicicum TaxID=2162 RepID=A0A0S4FSW2_METFO|nr:nidogen-like domain-containing protein [Methanobacterium formicicum]CEL25012.1 putative secreted protein [Methanobacterium formicicum]
MGKKISKKLFLIIFAFFVTLVFCSAVSAADADVQVNQTVNNSQPNLNDNITLNTTVTNNGPDIATGVQVTNKLPSGLTYKGYTASQGTYDAVTGIWYVGNLNSGQLATLFINATVNQTGTIQTIANKTSENVNDPQLDNNMQEVVLNVPNAVDMSVNQYLWYSSATYYYSNTPVFVVDVRNIGNFDDATNVVVKYIIADGYEYIATNTRGVGTATYDPTTKTITWIIPYMPKGAESTPGGIAFMNVYVRAIDTGVKTTNLTNTAQLVSVDQYDYNNSNNQKSYAITVPTAHDIQVNQNYTTFTDINGDQYIVYYITAVNNGPDDATGVTIKDLLPSGLEWIANTQTSGTTYDKTTGIWYIGNFNYGDAPKTLNITAKILATTGTIKNTAFLTAPLLPNFLDWNYDNNAQTTVLVLSGDYAPKTNITVNQYLWYSSATYYYDNTPVFVVDVRNVGNTAEYDDATNVVVKYIIADGYEYIATNTRGVGTATYDPTTKTITWIIPYMPKGAESTPGGIAFMNVYVRAIDTGVKTTNLTNTAQLVSPVYTVQPSKSYSITVPEAHDIQVNQNVTGSTNYNDIVTITITATNNGPDNATGVSIKDLLPSGLEWIANTQTSGTTYDKTTGIWYIGNFNYGDAPKTLNITARIKSTGTITNTAALTAPLLPNFLDWNYDNNVQTCTIEVPAAAYIGVSQSINNTSPTVNDTIAITVNAHNNGPDLATGINISDILPNGLEFVSCSTNYGSYSNGLWTIKNLLSGEIATLTIIAKAINVGNFTNIANKTFENQFDWNSTNNTASVNLSISGVIPKDIFTDEGEPGGVINDDDGTTSAITLPFPITFYGQTYNTIYINVNGLVSFGVPMPGPYYRDLPDNVPYIAAFWGDLDITNAGSVYYTIEDGKIVITWDHVPGYTQTDKFNTFRIIINSNGTYTFDYDDLQWANDLSNINSKVIINSGSGTNPTKTFWSGAQDLNLIANKEISFDSNGNLLAPYSHIGIDYTVNNSTPNYQDNVVYTITATNNGPTTATNVNIKSLIPSGLIYVSSSSPNYNSNTGIWTIGSLAPGSSIILTITAKVNQTGTITTYANTTKQDQFDPNPYDAKTSTLSVPNAAHLAVTYTVNNSTPNYQGNVVYTITANNNGPNTATGINISSKLPSGLTYVSSSSSNYNSNTGIWSIASLTSGSSVTLTITAKVNQTGTITTYANTTAQNQYDPNGYEKKTLTLTVPKAADIGVTVSASTTRPGWYSTFYIYIDVVNNGPDTSNGVEVTTSLPSGISFESVSSIPTGTSYNSNTGKWTIGTLASGQSMRLALLVERTFWFGSRTVNAQKTAETEYDPVTTNDSGSVVIQN